MRTSLTPLHRFLLLSCLFLGAGSSTVGQRIQSEFVLLDLIVEGGSGELIRDLKRADLEIVQNGKKQKINDFFLASDLLSNRSLAQSYPDVVPGQPPTIVVFIDLASVKAEDLAYLRQSVRTLLSPTFQSREAEYLLVTFRSVPVLAHGPTRDLEEFLKAVDQIEAPSDAYFTVATFESFVATLGDGALGAISFRDMASSAASEMIKFSSVVEAQTQALSNSLAAVSHLVGSRTGRKHLLLCSGGYTMQPAMVAREYLERVFVGRGHIGGGATRQQLNAILGEGSSVDLTQILNVATDQANRSQVSIYPLDPRFLKITSAIDHDGWIDAPHKFLSYLADQTGGRTIFEEGHLREAVEQFSNDLDEYYLVAFSPKGKIKVGRDHKVRMKSSRPGTRVRFRHGYRQREKDEIESADVLTALRFPDLFQGRSQTQIEQKGRELVITTMIPTNDLVLEDEGGQFVGVLEIFGALFDQNGKWVGTDIFFTKGQRLSFSPEKKEQLKNFANVTLTSSATAPAPGQYQVVVAVRQGAGGRLSTVSQPVTVQ